MAEWFPLPGTAAAPGDLPLVKAVRARFRSQKGAKPGSGYSWMWLLGAARIAPEAIAATLPAGEVLLYHEAQRRLQLTTAADVQRYVLALPPEEDQGVIVFPRSLAWCLAFGEHTVVFSPRPPPAG